MNNRLMKPNMNFINDSLKPIVYCCHLNVTHV